MRSKGQIGWEYILGAVIAAVVLILGYFAIYQWGAIDKFKALIPGYNNSGDVDVGPQIIGYNLTGDSIYYYSGAEWVSFLDGENVRLGDKFVYASQMHQDLKNYYYSFTARAYYASISSGASGEAPQFRFYSSYTDPSFPSREQGWEYAFYTAAEQPDLFPSAQQGDVDKALYASVIAFVQEPEVYQKPEGLFGAFGDFILSGTSSQYVADKNALRRGGDIGLILFSYKPNTKQMEFYGEILVRADGSVYLRKQGSTELNSVALNANGRDLVNQVIAWRDSILKGGTQETTVDLTYRVKNQNGQEKTITVQPEKIRDFVVVRLDKPTDRKQPGQAIVDSWRTG